MILRRMSEAIAKQDWAVVVIEVLIVVVGIFLGLQVDDWNQTRQDRKDEQVFLNRLHQDVLLAWDLSSRVRDRRMGRLQTIMDASDVLFGRSESDSLSDEQCIAIVSSNFFNINIASLSSLRELEGAGRLQIIQSAELRNALVVFQQTRDALSSYVALQTTASAFSHLPSLFPELIQLESYYDPNAAEIRTHSQCDLAGMRNSPSFLNHFSANADGYDAYVQDGLAPWIDQFKLVHSLLDQALNISHASEDGL